MNKRLLDLNMLSSLEALCCKQRKYVLLTPSWVKDRVDLTDLLLQESLGYHEVEQEVCRRQLCEVERKEKRLRAQIELELDPRTGEQFPIFPAGYQNVLREQARLRQKMAEHGSEIKRLKSEKAAQYVGQVLRNVNIWSHSQAKSQSAFAGNEGEIIEIFAGSYGLEPDPELRLLLRRFYLDLPDDKDWV